MRKASNTLNVSFEEAVEKMRGFRRAELIIRYRFTNADNATVDVKSMKASALYKDWYGNCNFCPSNDTYINHLHILLPTHVALDIAHDVQFECLLNALEEVTVGHKHRNSPT